MTRSGQSQYLFLLATVFDSRNGHVTHAGPFGVLPWDCGVREKGVLPFLGLPGRGALYVERACPQEKQGRKMSRDTERQDGKRESSGD